MTMRANVITRKKVYFLSLGAVGHSSAKGTTVSQFLLRNSNVVAPQRKISSTWKSREAFTRNEDTIICKVVKGSAIFLTTPFCILAFLKYFPNAEKDENEVNSPRKVGKQASVILACSAPKRNDGDDIENDGSSNRKFSYSGGGGAYHKKKGTCISRRNSSNNFRILAALQSKEELKKLQIARLLRELNELALKSSSSSNIICPSTPTNEDRQRVTKKWISLDSHEMKQGKVASDVIASLRSGAKLDKDSLLRLFNEAASCLQSEPTLLDLSDRNFFTVVGDLHGSFDSLSKVLGLIGDLEDDGAVVFTGNFVGREQNGLDVFTTVLLLKLAYPRQVFLCRGNHEDEYLSTVYGLKDELQCKYGRRSLDKLWVSCSKAFASLPICVRTKTAAILHGGLPSTRFELDDVKYISGDQRSKITSVIDPKDDNDYLLQGLLWSEPFGEKGMKPNEGRGAGFLFGKDVVRDFLERHSLKFLVRSHEPLEKGWEMQDCGDGRSILTVFSVAAYPNGEGFNKGAILHFTDTFWEPFDFTIDARGENRDTIEEQTLRSVVELIITNKSKLIGAFIDVEAKGAAITLEQWAQIMASQLDIPNLSFWIEMQPYLAPTTIIGDGVKTEVKDTRLIDWRRFLSLHSISSLVPLDSRTRDLLYDNHAMLLTVFKFLDKDGNGRLDRQEFHVAVNLLNKSLPDERKLQDADSLFEALDLDRNEVIELDEFAEIFRLPL